MKPIKRMFSGKIGRVPVAAIAIVLLGVLIAGGVSAAVSGYVLWEGTSTITVDEPITIYYGSSMGTCDTELVLSESMPDMWLWPGVCADTWFEFTSASTNGLLIKAVATTSDDAMVAVEFYDLGGSLSDIDGAGLVIDSGDGAVFIRRSVCVNGTAVPDLYSVSTTFTRESPPVP